MAQSSAGLRRGRSLGRTRAVRGTTLTMDKVKILMQLAMVGIFIWKVYEAVASYMDPPTGWQTRVAEDKDFHLPEWTLCASGHPMYKEKYGPVMASPNMTAAYKGMPEIDDIIFKLKMGNTDITDDMSKYFKYKYLVNNAYNFFFGCYTFKTPKEFSTTGFQKGIRAFVDFTQYSMLLSIVHNKGASFMSYSEIMGLKPVILMSSPVWHGNFTKFDSFVMKRTMMEKLSTEDEPCVDQKEEAYNEYDDGLQACFMRYLEDKLDCNLPWTVGANEMGIGKKSRVCNKPEEYDTFKDLNDKVMAMGVSEVRKNLGCKIPCSYFIYDIEKNADSWYPSITAQTGNEFLTGKPNIMHIDISVADRFYDEKKEIILYTGNHLIADIGGYLGLLLGISIINLYEMASEQGGNVWRKWNKHAV